MRFLGIEIQKKWSIGIQISLAFWICVFYMLETPRFIHISATPDVWVPTSSSVDDVYVDFTSIVQAPSKLISDNAFPKESKSITPCPGGLWAQTTRYCWPGWVACWLHGPEFGQSVNVASVRRSHQTKHPRWYWLASLRPAEQTQLASGRRLRSRSSPRLFGPRAT